jgi:hypothetical protein
MTKSVAGVPIPWCFDAGGRGGSELRGALILELVVASTVNTRRKPSKSSPLVGTK